MNNAKKIASLGPKSKKFLRELNAPELGLNVSASIQRIAKELGADSITGAYETMRQAWNEHAANLAQERHAAVRGARNAQRRAVAAEKRAAIVRAERANAIIKLAKVRAGIREAKARAAKAREQARIYQGVGHFRMRTHDNGRIQNVVRNYSGTRAQVLAAYTDDVDSYEQESWGLCEDHHLDESFVDVQNSTFENEPIHAAGQIDLDGFIKNADWCRTTEHGLGTCVPDWLTAKYKTTKGHIKSVKSYDVIQHYSTYEFTGDGEVASGLPPVPNETGYTLNHIKLYCKNTNKTLYALHNGEIIHVAAVGKCEDPLIIEIKNGHLYPYTSQHKIRSIVQFKSGGRRPTSNMKVEAPERIEFIDQEGNPLEFLVDTMVKHNMMPTRKICMSGRKLGNFKLGDTLFSTNPYCEHTEAFCKRNEIPYVGQSVITFFPKLLENFPKSYFNHEIYSALYTAGVKDRVHFGMYKSGVGSAEKIGLDINKAYRSVMENPLDDLIFVDFHTTIVYKTFDGSFGLWFAETEDRTLLNGSNWYSNIILERAQADGIRFTAEAFMSATPRGYVDQADLRESTKENGPQDLPEVIASLAAYFDSPQLTKTAINALSGFFGKTSSTYANLQVDKNANRAFKHLGDGLVFFQKNGIHVFGTKSKKQLVEGNLPIYIQILDWANMKLHDLILAHGGYENLHFRKTDEIVMKKLPIHYNFTKEIGGFKQSDVSDRVFGPARQHRAKFEYERVPWWNIDVKDSNDHAKVVEMLRTGNSLLISSRAGTGKSYVINKVDEELCCVKLALTNKAANNIGGQTVHSWLGIDAITGQSDPKRVAAALNKLIRDAAAANKQVCIVVDEYSMLPDNIWKHMYEIKMSYKIPFLIAGDWRQLPPIQGDVNVNHETIRFICDYRRCELAFHANCRYDATLFNFLEKLTIEDTEDGPAFGGLPIVKEVVGAHICFTNAHRKRVNARFNRVGVLVPWISNDEKPEKYHEDIRLAVGVPLLALSSSKSFDIVKNEIYTITSVGERTFNIGEREFSHADAHKFCLAYCLTIHKAQGITIEGPVNIHERRLFTRRMLYTAASRARKLEFIRFV